MGCVRTIHLSDVVNSGQNGVNLLDGTIAVSPSEEDYVEEIDPTRYRYFGITGVLVIRGWRVEVFESAHADDLPESEAGKEEIAERVRRHSATERGAPWESVEVTKFRRPDKVYHVPPGTIW